MCCIQLKLWPFCDILPILVKIWLPWQRPLNRCNQKRLLWIVQPRKLPVVSNRILVISHTNAFICIYSYFSPKIGCHSNDPLSLVYRSLTDEFLDSANPVSKPNSARICCTQLKLWPYTTKVVAIFVIFLPMLATNWLPWRRPLDPCNQKCLLWIGRLQTPLL